MTGLTPEILLRAYAVGLFPMAEAADDPDLFWVDPDFRGVLPLDGFHLPRRLARRIRHNPFTVTVDTDFAGVLDGCAEPTIVRLPPDSPPTLGQPAQRVLLAFTAAGTTWRTLHVVEIGLDR